MIFRMADPRRILLAGSITNDMYHLQKEHYLGEKERMLQEALNSNLYGIFSRW